VSEHMSGGRNTSFGGSEHVGGVKNPSISCFERGKGVVVALGSAGVCLIRKDLK
jgi:hypothetical protein